MRNIVRFLLIFVPFALLAGCSQAATTIASAGPSSTAMPRLRQAKAGGFTVLSCPTGTTATELADGDNYIPGGTTIFVYVARRYPDQYHYFETLHLLVKLSATEKPLMVYIGGFKEGQRDASDVDVTERFVPQADSEYTVSLDGATFPGFAGAAVIVTVCSGR